MHGCEAKKAMPFGLTVCLCYIIFYIIIYIIILCYVIFIFYILLTLFPVSSPD